MSVRNAIVLLLALCTLSLLVACGSYSPPRAVPPPSGGFSKSNLNGTYVFSSTGTDASGGFIAITGTIVANGSGAISGGSIDIVGVNAGASTAKAVNNSSYTVSVDGRGQAQLSTAAGPVTLDFVLISSSHGLVTEFDGAGSGSGTIDLQSTVTQAQLAQPYAFSLSGVDTNLNPFATAGSFTLDSSGNVTAGVQDFNDAGLPSLNQSLTTAVAATVGSGTGPGSVTLNTSFGQLSFDFYAIDATHLKFIETDFTQILAGDVFSQTGSSIPNSAMVFTMAGGTSVSGPISVGGVMTSDGTGNFTGGLEDVNNAGTVSAAPVAFTGSSAAGGSVGGRVIVNLSGFFPATQIVIYPSSGGLLMLQTDGTNISGGAAFAQTSTSLAASGGYGLNLSAFNGVEEDDIAEFVTSGTGFTGLVDINDQGSPSLPQPLVGTYNAPDSTGRGTASTTEHGNPFVSFTFYVADGSTFLLLETDSNQVGVGVFELQNAAAAGAAQPGLSAVRPTARTSVRSHGSLRHK